MTQWTGSYFRNSGRKPDFKVDDAKFVFRDGGEPGDAVVLRRLNNAFHTVKAASSYQGKELSDAEVVEYLQNGF